MSNSLIKYSFYESRTQTIVENLTWTQAHSLCRCLFKNGHESYFLHASNEKRWVPLTICIEDILRVDKDLMRTIPVPSDQFDNKTVVHHQLIDASVDRRQHQRFNKKLEVTFDIGGYLKKAHTVDISLGGMKIDTAIEISPTVQFAMAHIKHKNTHIEFKVKPIVKDGKFTTFSLISCSNLPTWKWLVEESAVAAP